MTDRFCLRTSSAIGALWYVDGAGSPNWTMERSAAYPFPSALAARLWRKGLGLTPADCRVVRVGPKRRASADAAALREVLAEILAGENGFAAPFRHDGNGPGHAHRVPGRWDRDGSPCAWCALWARADALVGPPDEKAPPAPPAAPAPRGRADGPPDGSKAVQRPAARPTGSQAPDPGGFQVGDVWELFGCGKRYAIAAGPSPDRVSVRRVSALGLGRDEGPWLAHDTGGMRLVSRAGQPWPPRAS